MGYFQSAELSGAPVLLALAGASGSGKTLSALLLAKGLAGGDLGKVFVIDTEARRALLHVPRFLPARFMHCDMRPPFAPREFETRMAEAVKAGARAIVVDNFSDEMEGAGGLQAMAEANGRGGPEAWNAPKREHRRLINYCRQLAVPVVFALRADEKLRSEPNPEKPGKVRWLPDGWHAIAEKRFLYDMTVFLTLHAETKGMPRYDLRYKMLDQWAHLFPEGKLIGEETGAAIKAWLDGAGAAPERPELTEWPLLHANLQPRNASSPDQWQDWCHQVLNRLEKPEAVVEWRAQMEPLIEVVEEYAPKAAEHVRYLAQRRLDYLAEGAA